jgi:hypothetical protein
MKILYFGSTYSDIYELWRAHLHYKDIFLANSVAQARFYLENQKINLIMMNHNRKEIFEVIEFEYIPYNTPIIVINSEGKWLNTIKIGLSPKLCPVSFVSIANPKAVVDHIKMKELHGMSYTG